MVSSNDHGVQETADLLQSSLIYNGEVLDKSLDALRAYKPGTQSLTYLESSVNLAYFLLRRLERHAAKDGGSYVRKKTKKKRGELMKAVIFVIPNVLSFGSR